MADKEMEERHLAESERHIALAEKNITKQRVLIERLETAGHDAVEAKNLLLVFIYTLKNMRDHHAQILEALAASSASS